MVYAGFLLWPLVQLLATSAQTVTGGSPTAANYSRFLTDEFYLEVLFRTFRLALISVLVLVMLSYPVALYLYLGGTHRRAVVLALLSPLFVSAVVRSYGWILVFVPGSGLLSSLPVVDGIGIFQTEAAIIVGLVHVLLPFMVLSIYGSLAQLDRKLLLSAVSLGAGPLRAIWDVVLPLTRPGALAGATLTFALASTAVSVPILLGGTFNKTVAYLIFQQHLVVFDRNFGAAISVILLVTTSLVLIASSVLVRERSVAAVQ